MSEGKCRFYFKTGSCRYGERCKYSHEGTFEGPKGPSLFTFLKSSNSLKTQNAMRCFVEAMHCYGNKENLIRMLADRKNFGLKRIQDIASARLGDSKFHIDVEYNRERVSFQRNVIPLLRVLTTNEMKASLQDKEYNDILSTVIEGKNFLANIRRCLVSLRNSDFSELLEGGSGTNTSGPYPYSLLPQTACDVFLPIVGLLRECWDRFQNKHADDEFLKFTEEVVIWTRSYIQEKGRSLPHKVHRIINRDIKALDKRLEILQVGKSLTRKATRLKESLGSPARSTIRDSQADSTSVAIVEFGRHDNDHVDFAKIEILPTREEIICKESPYLPKQNNVSFNDWDPAFQLLDRNFRLIRENLIGPLRRGLQELLCEVDHMTIETVAERGCFASEDGGGNETVFDLYAPVSIDRVCTDEKLILQHGIIFEVSFKWPKHLKGFDPKYSNRLNPTSLVALILDESDNKVVIFATIASRNVSDRKNPKVGLVICGPRYKDYTEMLFDVLMKTGSRSLSMLQAASLAYFNYGPVLSALKSLKADLPFPDVLARTGDLSETVRPPGYVMDVKGLLDMTAISSDLGQVNVLSDEEFSRISACTTMDDAQAKFLLDAFTREVFVGQGPPGTGKSYIGTKIVEIILSNHPDANPKNEVNIFGRMGKPLLCVTYTNHALDEFLSELIDAGITNVIRIGKPRESTHLSKSGKFLRTRTLLEVSKAHKGKPRYLYCFRHAIKQASSKLQSSIKGLREARCRGLTWDALKDHLEIFYEDIYNSFMKYDIEGTKDSEEFKVVCSRKNCRHFYSAWIEGKSEDEVIRENIVELLGNGTPEKENVEAMARQGKTRPLEDLLKLREIWETSLEERKLLMDLWLQEINSVHKAEIQEARNAFLEGHISYNQGLESNNVRLLKSAAVIGMTTTKAAKNQRLLRSLEAPVVIVEEAAEVLEGHILSSLSENTEHLIMIGDHMQLRPRLESYFLSKEARNGYNLDVSLFERLVGSKYPISTLTTQRRMRPEISNLVRETIYPSLKDHPDTRHEDIEGVCHNVYFIDHREQEDGSDAEHSVKYKSKLEKKKSHSNIFEATFCVNLARYFVQQGYNHGRVTILTPYIGQLLLLRDAAKESIIVSYAEGDLDALRDLGALEEDFATTNRPGIQMKNCSMEDLVRISSIDSFQGEESDIVIISLVRSNSEGKIGFLKTPNRCSVLLSRARKGLYIVGNAETFHGSGMWRNVFDILKRDRRFGNCIHLRCSHHPQKITRVVSTDDFLNVGDGGCNQSCSFRMPCGHKCPRRCHPDDPKHTAAYCTQPCMRIRAKEDCPYGHPCENLCGDPCGDCQQRVYDVLLDCGHRLNAVACAELQRGIKCQTLLKTKVSSCGHDVKLPCSLLQNKATEKLELHCPSKCGQSLLCGHHCQRKCSSCWVSKNEKLLREHGACMNICDRDYQCGHRCSRPCHEPDKCVPCDRKCDGKCEHSKCDLECKEPCVPCVEPCTWVCSHQGRCELPCGAPCSRLPCDERCTLTLSCGHQCPSVCGEPCPSSEWCQECGSPELKNFEVDLLERKTFKEINCTENPIIVLKCGHAYTIEVLDGIFSLEHDYYDKIENETGNRWTGLKPLEEKLQGELSKCPQCREVIRGCKRYGRAIKCQELIYNLKKHLAQMIYRVQAIEKEWNAPLLDKLLERDGIDEIEEGKVLRLLGELHRSYRETLSFAKMEDPRFALWSAVRANSQRMALDRGAASERSAVDKDPLFLIRSERGPRIRLLQGLGRVYQYLGLLCTLQLCRVTKVRDGKRQHVKKSRIIIEPEALVGLSVASAKSPFASSLEYLEDAHDISAESNSFIRIREITWQKINILRLWIDCIFRLQGLPPRIAGKRTDGMREKQKELLEAVEQKVTGAIESIERDEAGWRSPHLQPVISNLGKLSKEGLALLRSRVTDSSFYTTLSEKEKQEVIMGALEGGPSARDTPMTQRSNMYRCPLGHPYFIGECGRAMQEGTCPDCGLRIGGSRHTLDSSNRRYLEF